MLDGGREGSVETTEVRPRPERGRRCVAQGKEGIVGWH